MLKTLLGNKNFELQYKAGSVLENINTATEESIIGDVDEIGLGYGKAVANFLNIVKGEIIPAMGKVESILLDSIQSKDFGIKSNYGLEIIDMPSLFSNLNEHGGLNMVGNGTMPNSSVTLPVPALEDIRNWFITDSEDINYDLEATLSSKTDEELMALWERYLMSFSSDNILLKDLDVFHFSKADELALLYAAVRNLSVKVPDLVSNLNAFRSSSIDMFDYIKACISKYLRLYTAVSETTLVHSIRVIDGTTTAYVFDTTYNRFIDESGYGVDAIIGFVIDASSNDGRYSISLEDMLAKEEVFQRVQAKNIDLEKIKTSQKKIEGYFLTYKVYSSAIYKEVISGLSSTITEETYNTIYQELLHKTEREHLELNVELFVRNLFSMIYPRVKLFLDITTQIDSDFSENGEKLSPNEVVLYATIELITTELMNQVTVTEVQAYKV